MSNMREIDLASLFDFALERQSKALRVGMPGVIETFDSKSQTASVKPLLFEHDEAEDGTEENEPLGIISGVPVQFPAANGFILTFPVKKGDKVWLQFGDRSLENWFKKGTDVDPVDLRRHALSDAVAILGVFADPDKITEFDTSRMVIGKQGGKRLAFTSSELHLGVDHNEAATDYIALAPATKHELQALRNTVEAGFAKLDGHKHGTNSLIINTTGTAVKQAGTSTGDTDPGPSLTGPDAVGDVASLHVKSK